MTDAPTTETIPYIHESLRHLAVPIDSLVPDPRNARDHDERNLETIRRSLERWGQRAPIVVQQQGRIVRAGNARLRVATELGWTHISAIVCDESDAEAIAFAVADNRTAELASWNLENLSMAMNELPTDLRLDAGFEPLELAGTLGTPANTGKTDQDSIPPAPAVATTKPGELILLGDHRLLCGDSTSAADVARLMDGETARMAFTDPPWNINIGCDNNPRHRKRAGLKNDNISAADFGAFIGGLVRNLKDIVRGDVYVVMAVSEMPLIDSTLRAAGARWSGTMMWVKDVFVLGWSNYHRRFEPIWYGWFGGKSSFCGRRDLDDVWECPRPKRSEEHPTMKPVELVATAVQNSSAPGDLVVDLFGGGGSTLIACEKHGRRCFSMEIEPVFCDVIVARWEAFTGRKAERIPANEKAPAEAGAVDVVEAPAVRSRSRSPRSNSGTASAPGSRLRAKAPRRR